MLQKVYGDNCLSGARIFEWYTWFKDGNEDYKDDERYGRPLTSKTDQNRKSELNCAKRPWIRCESY